MNCYTIPAFKPFLLTLARWLYEQYGHDQVLLTKTLVLLPGRRACKGLQEAFLEITQGMPLLLPRIQPIGESESEDYGLFGLDESMPPPIPALRRQLLLMRLVDDFERRRQKTVYNMEKISQLAYQLAHFMDEVNKAGLDFNALQQLVPDEMSRHWQQTVEFLRIISVHWPQMLVAEGFSDTVPYRNRVFEKLILVFQETPPDFPIIAAGSTGSQPATAALLSAIARLPTGKVILPGIDMHMREEDWKLVDETHPQFMIRQLLEKMGCSREKIRILGNESSSSDDRTDCLREILRPAPATASWQEAPIDFAKGLKNLHVLSADTLLEEAKAISLLMREALEVPGKTAALITPDRVLARMVSAQLGRFDISVNDSAGRALTSTPAGVYLRLIAELAISSASPAMILALLRHPLAAAGLNTAHCRYLSTVLEKELLRGIRKQMEIGDLAKAAEAKNQPELAGMLSRIHEALVPLIECFKREKIAFGHLLMAHIEFAEWMASTDEETGKDRLWSREAGNHVALWLAELSGQSGILPDIDPAIYPATFSALMGMQSYWPQQATHPRLHILSPIEARLQQYDRVILGGLNEGSWPATTHADPWMSRPMRKAFGLPAAERAIGQAAHDMFMACHAPEVWLTRARKVENTPTVASRWLMRMETLVSAKATETFQQVSDSSRYGLALSILDTPLVMKALEMPAPLPPLHARPLRMRVTDVDKWLHDPYVIYARYILGLKALEPMDREPSAVDFGTAAHKALELFTRKWPKELPAYPEQELMECGREAFATFIHSPSVTSLWLPRFQSIVSWLIEQERQRRKQSGTILSELEGTWTMAIDGKPFTIVTCIDRLELNKDGSATVVDYKTGSLPTDTKLRNRLANQLFLEGLILKNGSLSQPLNHSLNRLQLEYWKLAATQRQCEVKKLHSEDDDFVEVRNLLEELVKQYMSPVQRYTAQTDSKLKLEYNDYEHLTRRQEWEAL